MGTKEIRRRARATGNVAWSSDVHPVLQRVYAARGITDTSDIEHRLARMLTPAKLGGIAKAVELLTHAIQTQQTIVVAGDYDCDGATGAAVAVRGLRLLGANHVSFVVPNRFTHGYGLTPALVADMQPTPDVIVTVDSGVASVDGVAAAKARGITVIITDHHLPADILPAADAIVNPNLKGDTFPSKMLAGVGVMFYLLIALRTHLHTLDTWVGTPPDLGRLLDLVALGTVADLVVLDHNNRILVEAGLRRIRQGKAQVGLQALITISGKDSTTLVASDIAFSVAPRLNAAGRLENMSLGVEALLTDDPNEAKGYVQQLDAINKERRELQADMIAMAETIVATTQASTAVGVSVFDPSWHAGVVGLVASKLKETLHRPVFAFAPGGEGSTEVRGSGRSIAGFHLRDALVAIDAKHPGLILKFGGHAMAAGLSLRVVDVDRFAKAFDEVATAWLDDDRLQDVLLTDGELLPEELTLSTAYALRDGGPWGQGFPEPIFENEFECVDYKVVGKNHLRMDLRVPGTNTVIEAIQFSGYHDAPPPARLRAVYELTINRWRDRDSLKLMIRHLDALP